MTVLKRASLDTLAAFGYGYGKPLRALLPIVLVLLTFLFFRKRVTGQAVLDQADWYVSLIQATVVVAVVLFAWNLVRAPLKIANSTLLARAEAAEHEIADLKAEVNRLRPIADTHPGAWATIRLDANGKPCVEPETQMNVATLLPLDQNQVRLVWARAFRDTAYQVTLKMGEGLTGQEEQGQRRPDSIVLSIYPWPDSITPTAHLTVAATGPAQLLSRPE